MMRTRFIEPQRFMGTTPEHYALAFNAARGISPQIAAYTSEFSDAPHSRYFISHDMLSGFAIRQDGELVLVWSLVKGRGDHLMREAIHAGARHLDCFDGYLPTLYSRHGFSEVRREDNWTPGEPDVVFMALV